MTIRSMNTLVVCFLQDSLIGVSVTYVNGDGYLFGLRKFVNLFLEIFQAFDFI